MERELNIQLSQNTGLTLTLTRSLVLPGNRESPLQLSDVLTTVPFRGPDYIVPPGAEGVASLVFDIPEHARGVRGGPFEGDESETRRTQAIFEVRCVVEIKMSMGLGRLVYFSSFYSCILQCFDHSKDIHLELPVTVVHPAALPELPLEQYTPPAVYPYASTSPAPAPMPIPTPVHFDRSHTPYAYPALPLSPPNPAYIDQNHVWLPPPVSHTPHPYQYFSPPVQAQQPYYPPSPPALAVPAYVPPPRPSSAGPSSDAQALYSGLPPSAAHQPLLPLDMGLQPPGEPEDGKGERASRVTHHLRLSSRHRSASPRSHRFPLPALPSSDRVSVPVPETPHLHPRPSSASPGKKKKKRNGVRLLPIPPPIAIPADNLSVSSQGGSSGVVLSPRPMPSPKHTYTVDPITQRSLPKSERVENLERMAAEVEAHSQDLSGDLLEARVPADCADPQNKTLPAPPVPSGKDRVEPAVERPRADAYFAEVALALPDPVPAEKTPPTPTLTAVTPAKHHHHHHYRNDLVGGESGLDALERRLLAEVGTRKPDAGKKRPDVRIAVQPIMIPRTSGSRGKGVQNDGVGVGVGGDGDGDASEPLNDSAISSLTLAAGDRDRDHDSDERTHRAGKSSLSGEEREGAGGAVRGDVADYHDHAQQLRPRGRAGGKKSDAGRADRDDGNRSGKQGERERERGKDGDGRRMRKAAKGKVAAWLGGIDPKVPPSDDVVPPSPSVALEHPMPPIGEPFAPPPVSMPVDSEAGPQVVEKDIVSVDLPVDAKPASGPSAISMGKPTSEAGVVGTGVSCAPNPRSSGFVPIGTLKRDTLQRHPITRETAAVGDARRITDIWSSPPVVEVSSPTVPSPLLISPISAPWSIGTDRKVSPPSSSDGLNGKLSLKAPDDHTATPAIPPLAKKLAPPTSRLPVFPPPRLDPEVKYDIRSARGGRGGKVTAVASIWASGAFSGPKTKEAAKPLLPTKPSSSKPVRSSTQPPSSAVLGSRTDVAVRETRGRRAAADVAPPSRPSMRPPPPPPARSSSARNAKSDDPEAQSAGSPAVMSLPSSSSSSTAGPKLVELTKRRTGPVVKSSSVPAAISSSYATPTLSSTASLARPSPSPYKRSKTPAAGAPAISEAGGSQAAANATAARAQLPGDLVFGQARLRDLIRKYQAQAN